jgi:hypothetical protein
LVFLDRLGAAEVLVEISYQIISLFLQKLKEPVDLFFFPKLIGFQTLLSLELTKRFNHFIT